MKLNEILKNEKGPKASETVAITGFIIHLKN